MADVNPFAADQLPDAAASNANPYSMGSIEASRRSQLRQSVYGALSTNPDQFAEAKRLGASVGVPADVASRNLDEVRRRATLDQYDQLLGRAPAVADRFANDPDFARVAHDDVGSLAAIEGAFAKALGQGRASYGYVDGPEYHRPTGQLRATEGSVLGGLFNADRFRARSEGMSAAVADALGMDPAPALRRSEIARSRAEAANPQIENDTVRFAYQGLVSFVDNAPGMALSILTGNPVPALALAGGQTASEAYPKYRARGGTAAQAALGAGLEGAIEAGTELLPMSELIKGFGRGGKEALLAVVKSQLGEQVGEQIATHLQDAVDTAIANPEKTWSDYLQERPGAAYQTVVATLVQSGVIGAAHAAARQVAPQQEAAQQAEATVAHIEQIDGLAQASKLKERDPQAFRQFIEGLTEESDLQDVYVSHEALADALHQSAITQAQLEAFAPAVGEQLREQVPGADVRIPVAELLSAPPDISAALMDHIRAAPDAMSRLEAQEFVAQQGPRLQEVVEQQIVQQRQVDSLRQEFELAKGHFEQQLQQVNRYSKDVNTGYATLLASYYSTQAQRAGVPIKDFIGRYGVHIVAQTPAGALLDQFVPIKPLKQAAKWVRGVLKGEGEGAPRQDDSTRAEVTRGSFDPNTFMLALMKAADLSTLAHESGHAALEIQADLAARIVGAQREGAGVSDGELQIAKDFNTILAWFGIEDTPQESALQQWLAMSLDEKREFHEQWARGFERWLGEGKAPSLELQTLFARFRAWLIQVYRQLKALNVDLSEDVRQVMDRLIASDEAIAEARDARALGPLFQTPEQAGMSAEEFRAYQSLGEAATAQASAELDGRLIKDLRWLSRAREKALKARQAEVATLRREIRSEVRGEVLAQPVYRAWSFLTGKELRVEPGIQAAETIDATRQSGKLRTSYLKEAHPEQWRILSERRMTSDTNGMDPDIVAGVIPGFTSGDHLVRALAEAPAPEVLIDELTDQRMLERYGDIASPHALADAADRAVQNEMRARVVAAELKALEKATTQRSGRRSEVDAMARAARQYAEAIIARQRVRDLRPGQYAAAQARSARLAREALGKSVEEAAQHKRVELINGYAARAAQDAQAEIRDLQKYFRRFDKRPNSIDAGYLDQIEQLLERYDFRPATLKEVDRRKSFRAWYDEQVESGLSPNVPDQLLEDSSRRSYRDATVEEVRGLADTIRQIEHQGRLKKRLLLARDQRDLDNVADEIESSIVAHGGEKRAVKLEGENPITDWFAGAWASHRKLASLFRQMDGNRDTGPLYTYIGRAMNDRSTMEDIMVEKATVALGEIYAPLTKLRGGITGHRSKLFIPEIGDSLTRGGRLAVALNWGNEANRQRLADGNKWSPGQVHAVLKTLTSEELAFVNKAWEFLDSYWPEIAAKEKRLAGVEPEKVEAVPFVVHSADGVDVQMRGGYYPLKYDANASDKADQQEAAQAAKEMMQGVFTRATTRRGHMKERLKEVKRKVRLDLNVITQHVTQVVHDLAWHEFLIDTNRLLGDERIAGAIRSHYGPQVLKTMRDDILGIATADVVPQTSIDKALLLARSNVSRATMGASLTTAFLQPFGLTQSMYRIGIAPVMRGMARWAGDASRMESTINWINERSDFMRLRSKTFNRELREVRGTVAGKSKAMKAVDAGLFVLMQKMQLVADVPTWLGQYEKSKGEGLSEADAVAMADRAVLESQGGGATKDLAEVQRKHPMLTQFYSYFSTTLNLAAESTAATNFKHPAAVAGWLGDMALLLVIPAIGPSLLLYALKGGGGGGGDDDDLQAWAKRIAQWQVGYLLSTVVLARELSGAVSGFDYSGPPVGRIVGDFGKAGKQTAQGEFDEPLVMAYAALMGTAFGLPMTQILRSYRGWKVWDEGRDGAGPQSVLFGPPSKN